MRRAAILIAIVPIAACAQLLSFDDYKERGAPAPVDSAVAVDSFVEDTRVDADAGPPPARVPTRPGGAATPSGSGKTLWLAAQSYSYGLSDSTAWSKFGYDLDEVCTLERESVENINTCRRPMGAKQDSLIDGERCRDNNFARHVGALLGTTLPDSEKTLNGLVLSGSTTWILRIDDVDNKGDDAYAPGAFYRSSDDRMTTPPKWDGNDDRAVQADSLVSDDLGKPVINFPRGFVAGGVWMSGEPAPIEVIAPITAVGFFPLKLESAFISVELDEARTTGTHGLLVGALAATEIERMFQPIADFAVVCPGTTLYINALAGLRTMPDLVIGAPKLQDLERTCDGVSTALAFELKPIKPVTRVVPPSIPRKPRCGDAG